MDNGSLDESIQISSDGRQLHILRALQDHVGLYRCHAENPVGSSDAFFQLLMDGTKAEFISYIGIFWSLDVDSFVYLICFPSFFLGSICAAEGDWGEWSDWSTCSVSCGPGVQERKRACLTSNCVGEETESVSCYMSYCPVRKTIFQHFRSIHLLSLVS